ncbi:flagellar hook assembly protein FlgD [Alsobacter sp. SYSU M60028]|uniref:Basal-body rod modification protein FlgD n=1 Tax=Alsobacter ponti TaxID=2962936 RepID=A0ABT1LII8_9HYPH|nr:flagellar hook capping FlgD N-terminal domain-containing protein [Alsobacter ponti]MCP8940946.1 flagellar hook assembly protein FlgD [Alsobacter ponti]
MAVTAAASSPSSAASSAGTDRKMLANNFDEFLLLLTTQLKNQNPLEPLNTNEFTQQLVQFASVEQQIKSNDTLGSLLTATKASTATNALGFVGAEIRADGATTRLSGGRAEWNLSAPKAASRATLAVRDASGATVYSETRSLAAGSQSFVWDGRTSSGATAPVGDYTLSVTASDLAGAAVNVSTEIVGTVDAVDLTGSSPLLAIGSVRVPVENVKSMRKPSI